RPGGHGVRTVGAGGGRPRGRRVRRPTASESNRMTRKHSVIVGGTKGVGRELAGLFAAAGQHVTAVGRNPGEFPAVSGGGQIEGFPGNVEDADALLAALLRQVEKRGRLSSLVFLQRYRGSGDAWAGELAVSLT